MTPCWPSCAHAKASFPHSGSSVSLRQRVPTLLGGGGGGVSGGSSKRVDGVICIHQLFQEHVSVHTRFRKAMLHQVLCRLTRDQPSRTIDRNMLSDLDVTGRFSREGFQIVDFDEVSLSAVRRLTWTWPGTKCGSSS